MAVPADETCKSCDCSFGFDDCRQDSPDEASEAVDDAKLLSASVSTTSWHLLHGSLSITSLTTNAAIGGDGSSISSLGIALPLKLELELELEMGSIMLLLVLVLELLMLLVLALSPVRVEPSAAGVVVWKGRTTPIFRTMTRAALTSMDSCP